jgi:hypothetical protein
VNIFPDERCLFAETSIKLIRVQIRAANDKPKIRLAKITSGINPEARPIVISASGATIHDSVIRTFIEYFPKLSA